MDELEHILRDADDGDPRAAEQLLPLVYTELRQLAERRLASEKPGQTLQATALVHEAYLRLVGASQPGWSGRHHFFAAAAEAMRRILIERARRHRAPIHGGGLRRLDLEQVEVAGDRSGASADDLLALDEALTRFAREAPLKAELVKLRYFAGLSIEEAAAALGLSRATASRHWRFAKAWLFHELNPPEDPVSNPEKP